MVARPPFPTRLRHKAARPTIPATESTKVYRFPVVRKPIHRSPDANVVLKSPAGSASRCNNVSKKLSEPRLSSVASEEATQ